MNTLNDIPTGPPGPSSPYSTISMIIPVYRGGEHFRQCLASLRALTPQPFEIIVVADGDPDGSGDLAEACGVRVVRLNGPSGPAKARNVGAQHASGNLLFFVDADVIVPVDTIARIHALFSAETYPSAVIGSYDDRPAAVAFVSQYRNLLHHYVHQRASEQAWTFWGACGAIKTTVFHAVGGFDESYRRPSIEDIEFGYRIRRAGNTIQLCKSLVVKHLKCWTLIGMIRTDILDRALPWTELILTHGDLPNDLNVNVAARLSGALVILFALSVLLIPWAPILAGIAVLSLLGLLGLNGGFYRFLSKKRGTTFALLAIPLHALYYAYSSLAFAVGAVRYGLFRRVGRRASQWPDSRPSKRFRPEGPE